MSFHMKSHFSKTRTYSFVENKVKENYVAKNIFFLKNSIF